MADDENERSVASAGSVAGDPFVWAVLDSRGTVVAYTCRETAEAYCNGTFNQMIPLYRQPQPTLTDAEREAITDAADRYAEITPESAETAATLRSLLERLA